MNNLTVTEYVYYFNASTAIVTKPEGVSVETRYSPYDSRIEIIFYGLNDSKQAVVVLRDMKITGNISIDEDRRFSSEEPGVEGDLNNCTHILSHFCISANTPLGKINLYSDSKEGIVKEGKMEWNNWPQSKTKTFTVSTWALLFLSATISSLIVYISSFALKIKTFQRLPIVTFAILSTMCFIYVLIGVGNDFISVNNASEYSRYILSFFSMVFHIDYSHLMGNLLYGFVISGSLMEIWFLRARKLNLYLWYFSPIPISIFLSMISISGSIAPSVGASYWIIGMTVALTVNVIGNRTRIQQSASRSDFIALLFLGYLMFSTVWNYIANVLIFYYSEESVAISAGHLLFLTLYSIFAGLSKIMMKNRRDLTSR